MRYSGVAAFFGGCGDQSLGAYVQHSGVSTYSVCGGENLVVYVQQQQSVHSAATAQRIFLYVYPEQMLRGSICHSICAERIFFCNSVLVLGWLMVHFIVGYL